MKDIVINRIYSLIDRRYIVLESKGSKYFDIINRKTGKVQRSSSIMSALIEPTIEQVNFICNFLINKHKYMDVKIQLPEGYYFETSSDKRVATISVKKEELSVGDYVKDAVTGDTFIIDKISDISYNTKYIFDFDGTFREMYDSYSKERAFYRLTDEEKKGFDLKLKTILGIKYDAKENKYVRCRDRKYYFISGEGDIIETYNSNMECDNDRYEFGNYFISEEQAKIYLDKIKSILNVNE